jgi:AcrR family transcriptional regulator
MSKQRFNFTDDFSTLNETQMAILEEAELILGKVGVSGLELKNIATKLGVSASLINHYYKTGEELVFETVIYSYQKYIFNIQNINRNQTDPEMVIRSWVENTMRWTRESPGIGVILEFPIQAIRGTKFTAQPSEILTPFLKVVADLGQRNVSYLCSAIRCLQKGTEFKVYPALQIAAFIKSDARFAMYSSTVGFTTLGGGLWIAGRQADDVKNPFWMKLGFNPASQINSTLNEMIKLIKTGI